MRLESEAINLDSPSHVGCCRQFFGGRDSHRASQAFDPVGGAYRRRFPAGHPAVQGTCLLPFGILEKHGPHLPLGTDLLNVRYASLHAASQEYAVVFPEYYFGQIFEAKHEPVTVAYSMELQLRLLQETTDEMARNGCKQII